MILPTETINELFFYSSCFSEIKEYIDNLFKKGCCSESFKLINERFDGSKNNFEELFIGQNLANEWLRQAESLYICGLAFNIYDHELTNTIALSTQRKNWKKICVVNRENKENDKEKKCDLVAAILRLDSEKIEFVDTIPKSNCFLA